MSFFNLTLMGYDNRFDSMKRLEPIQQRDVSNEIRQAPEGRVRTSLEKHLAREITGNIQSREWSTPAISNLNYHTLRQMHVRGDHEHNHTLRAPITTAQQIGWWTKDEPLKTNEPWTNEKRYVHPQAEMTRFADDMMLSDRYFRLY